MLIIADDIAIVILPDLLGSGEEIFVSRPIKPYNCVIGAWSRHIEVILTSVDDHWDVAVEKEGEVTGIILTEIMSKWISIISSTKVILNVGISSKETLGSGIIQPLIDVITLAWEISDVAYIWDILASNRSEVVECV